MRSIDQVEQFHRAMGLVTSDSPVGLRLSDSEHEVAEVMIAALESMAEMAEEIAGSQASQLFLRMHLMMEELAEVAQAWRDGDRPGLLKELSDLQYVVDGTYVTVGLAQHKDAAMHEVHRSNMSKLGEDGRPIVNENGRVLKGPNYSPAEMARVLETREGSGQR